MALLATDQVRAGESSYYLKGVTMVTYLGVGESNPAHCDIDWKAWNTAIDFVANQSVKLKLMRVAPDLESMQKFGLAPMLMFDIATN